ncbi:uncharacterized protein BJ171DRAFT_486992 [Polychytrium aggregatum]|uniref:uncharacterized protein n=1 Tax=Polychytrium aggregatum TaxID=110093 RepID=UPI0022FE720E|nr:uncharacterized protein BJ171DRAFT_486992 [Polychytrium aggregatum]KAI9209436.1 hypothetical protein BJ171DRAFT_486992 [Polychytrium aggregatum]
MRVGGVKYYRHGEANATRSTVRMQFLSRQGKVGRGLRMVEGRDMKEMAKEQAHEEWGRLEEEGSDGGDEGGGNSGEHADLGGVAGGAGRGGGSGRAGLGGGGGSTGGGRGRDGSSARGSGGGDGGTRGVGGGGEIAGSNEPVGVSGNEHDVAEVVERLGDVGLGGTDEGDVAGVVLVGVVTVDGGGGEREAGGAAGAGGAPELDHLGSSGRGHGDVGELDGAAIDDGELSGEGGLDAGLGVGKGLLDQGDADALAGVRVVGGVADEGKGGGSEAEEGSDGGSVDHFGGERE